MTELNYKEIAFNMLLNGNQQQKCKIEFFYYSTIHFDNDKIMKMLKEYIDNEIKSGNYEV